jgi:Lanthionine synthetase C-like protein
VLYRPDWHEPLTDRAWDDAWVRDAVAALVGDAVGAWDDDGLWPAHPSDGDGAEPPLTDLYCGAAGVVWALARLGADFDAPAAAARTHERFRPLPLEAWGVRLPAPPGSSLFLGETGIAFVRHALAPSEELRDLLVELVRANLDNGANELMWGVPGTLLVARAVGADDAARESADALRTARDENGWWTQDLYGHVGRYLGPIHGLVGNAFALGELDTVASILREQAVREDAHVNWPPGPDDAKFRLQWCHGAPGIITTAAEQLDDDLLLGSAQLIWDAGPLESTEKGSGLCHGTAGNGYALLKTFERTQDELWLERARAFAVHALEQAQSLPPRYSLFTGGIGAALFAVDCAAARARFPVLDEIGTLGAPPV